MPDEPTDYDDEPIAIDGREIPEGVERPSFQQELDFLAVAAHEND